MSNPLVQFLKLFHDIPSEDEAVIASAMQTRNYKEGDYLFKANKIYKEMFFVCKGVIRIMVADDQGREVTHFFLKENQFCSILNSFNNGVTAKESIQAACKAEVLAISRANLDKLNEKLPYLQLLINQIVQQALLDKIAMRTDYLGKDSTTRYKMFMMRQADIALQIPLSDIASYLDITPQSLSRIRKKIH